MRILFNNWVIVISRLHGRMSQYYNTNVYACATQYAYAYHAINRTQFIVHIQTPIHQFTNYFPTFANKYTNIYTNSHTIS